MAADRTNTQQHAEQKPAGEEHPRYRSASTGASPSSRAPVSLNEPASVRLSEGSAVTGGPPPPRPHPHVPSPAAPPAHAGGAAKTPPAHPVAAKPPVFTVKSFTAKEAGNNAILTPRAATLLVDSPLFTSSATVHSPKGNPDVANWDVGYIQTAASHHLETLYVHTTKEYRVATPVRDAAGNTAAPWYFDKSPAVPGTDVAVSMSDHPAHGVPWKDPRTGELNALVKTSRRFGLKTWLIARNRVSQAIVYLKHISWGLNYIVDVDSAARTAKNSGPGMVAPASGNGQGGSTPVLKDPIYNTLVNDASNATVTARAPAPAAPAPHPAAPAAARPHGATTGAEVSAPIQSVSVSGAAGGSPLPPAVQAPLSRSLGVDLRGVRVHSDSHAQGQAQDLSARAFTFGNHVFLGRGESASDVGLIAHEAAHVVQQRGAPAIQRFTPGTNDTLEREAHQASAAVIRGESFQVQQRTTPRVQRWGLSTVLDYFADKANIIPGFRMFTILLGVNPINMSSVDRSAANILRAVVEFIPGGGLITQALDNYGIFDKAGKWLEGQFRTLGDIGRSVKNAISEFLDSLGWRDVLHLGRVWDRAKRIFTDPIDRIISFVKGLVVGFLTLIRDALLIPLAKLAEKTPGWDLLKAVLGRNPITGEPVPQNAETLIGGFMKLIGQEEIWANIKKANALSRAWAWFKGALSGLLDFVTQIPSLIIQTIRSIELMDIILLPRVFIKVGKAFLGFLGRFFSWAMGTIFDLLQIIFEVVAPGAVPYLKKVAASFKKILKDPIGFVKNLVKAGKQGFNQFKDRIGEHLKGAFLDWLTGSIQGVYIPKSFGFGEIAKFALSVLGVSWANIRLKLVKAVGETTVKAMEVGFDLVKTLVTEGPAAAWEQIKQGLSNLVDMVVQGVISFIVETLVKKAVAKVVSLLIPGAAFIQAILMIYDTIKVFIEKLKKIIEVATAFLNSILDIANGVIGAAADKVETTLKGLLALAISFLAGFAGLGKVADKINEILNTKVRAPIDKALDKVVEWIVAQARRFGRAVVGAVRGRDERTAEEKQRDLNLALDAAAGAVNRFAGRRVGAVVLTPLLFGIRTRYRLNRLEPVLRGDQWTIEGEINPRGSKRTSAIGGTPIAIHYNPSPLDEYGRSTQAIGEPLIYSPELNASERNMTVRAPGKFLIPSQYRYNDGHLLPHSFGGPDDDARNLAGVSVATNAQFSQIEGRVRRALQANQAAAVRYIVSCHYASDGPGQLETWMKEHSGIPASAERFNGVGSLIFNMIKGGQFSLDQIARHLGVNRLQLLNAEAAIKLKAAQLYLPQTFTISIPVLSGGISVAGGTFDNHLPNPRNPSRPGVPASFLKK
jgi:hypothetical protein